MASISFPLSNHLTGRAASSPQRHQFRLSGGRANATPRNAPQTLSFYEVLGVRAGATCQEIKTAYRKKARVLHPDAASDGRGDDTLAADEFIRLQAAYDALSDPVRRAVYNRSLFRLRGTTSATPLRGGCRNWETDQCW